MSKKLIGLDSIKPDKPANEYAVATEKISKRDIAIIGMSAKFPMADNVSEYWNNIKNGLDCVRRFPENRKKDAEAYINYTQKTKKPITYYDASYLDEIDKFDYNFFNIPPKEASLMNPYHRMFLETVWAAIEDAGYGGNRIVGTSTGVYIGYKSSLSMDYQRFIYEADQSLIPISEIGNNPPIMGSRISHILDLKGPSILIDASCASTLTALHAAVSDIRNGACEMAIIGGARLYILPVIDGLEGGLDAVQSRDGRTRSFDNNSDGTNGGEGATAILIKPLSKAISDGDNIHAVIKGTAVNHDGRSIGITAPNPKAQEDVISSAWKDAGIDPQTISYIECHGTGTKLGDPVEIEGIERAFRRYTDNKQFCAVGSVKSNIGHMDNVAGLAGLLKSVMALKNKKLPPSNHFTTPNMNINFINSPVYINDKLKEWEADGAARRCGVSAFGVGGTNVHVVLEEAPEPNASKDKHPDVFVISAITENSLKALIKSYKSFIEEADELNLNDICFTANTGRWHYNYRLALICKDEKDLKQKIRALDCYKPENNNNLENVYYNCHKAALNKDYYSTGSQDKEQINKDADLLIDKFLQSGKTDKNFLKEICRLYTGGADIKWQQMYAKEKRKKVSLPTYAFEKNRCWLEAGTAAKGDIAETSPIRLIGREQEDYTQNEKYIAAAWNELTGYKEVNIHDNFFSMGIDSVKVSIFASKLKTNFDITIKNIFEYPTIESLAEYLTCIVEPAEKDAARSHD